MRLTVSITALLMALAPAVVAQNATYVSLGDIARQSRAHAGTAKRTWDNQNSDFGRSTDDSGTPCGAGISGVPDGYVSGEMGKQNVDPELAKALLRWLDKHPDLDVMHPEDIAKIVFPVTASQIEENRATAKAAAQQWVRESMQTPDPNSDASVAPGQVNTTYTTGAKQVLPQAVQAEQDRRIRSDGSAADKLQEAVNLYSICESRRLIQFEGDVDKLAKQEFQKSLQGATETAQGK